MSCNDSSSSGGSGSSGRATDPNIYRGGNQGGRDRWPLVVALAVVAQALIGLSRHHRQPLGDPSGCV